MMKRRVAVIGAGASGLAAIKCCLEEGFEPVCFERTDQIGGLWYYTPDAIDGQGCVMKSTVINTSKEMMCYSDFPIPGDYPNFMHNTKVLEYFNLYADHFHLKDTIQFETEILSIKKTEDFNITGRWVLQVKDLKSSDVREEIFEAVFVCTGHHREKHMPSFPGLDKFKGKVVHTHDYKDHLGYENKRVVVIGIGNSGGDVAVELGKVSKQVFLSTRTGTWVINRVAEKGLPTDMVHTRRVVGFQRKVFSSDWLSDKVERRLNQRFDHTLYGLQPNHHIGSQHPMVNDDLPNRIISGSVTIKPNVKCVTETGVLFDDETFEDDIDVIIFATGYIFGFPFIDKDIIDVKENQVELYKYVYPPCLKPATLAVIGCVQPRGAIMPISEMQCRWATRLWKGEVFLPPQEVMWNDIRTKQEAMAKRYVKSQRHTIQVDYVAYMDELAEQVGCKPDLKRLFLSDPVLGWKCLMDSCTPYQYRLQGPHPWAGAREAILTQWNRVYQALSARKVDVEKNSTSSVIYLVMAVVILFVSLTFIF